MFAGLSVVLAGCGSGGSTTSPRPVGVSFSAANVIQTGTPKAQLTARLGEPVLTSRPTESAPGGCVYYAMKGRPLADVWQFCLDAHDRVSEGATLYSPSHPPPPDGASAAREVLITRGDAACQGANADLVDATKQLARTIPQLSSSSGSGLRHRAASLTDRVARVLGDTRSQLGAFVSPPDEQSSLNGYLDALDKQAADLHQAATALATRRDQRYFALREQLNQAADSANADAEQYGFATCSTVRFG